MHQREMTFDHCEHPCTDVQRSDSGARISDVRNVVRLVSIIEPEDASAKHRSRSSL